MTETAESRTDILMSDEIRGVLARVEKLASAGVEAISHGDRVAAWNAVLSLELWAGILGRRLKVRVSLEE